ncbi:uncharacterized protein LOC110250379 [Exaiptasia diaphana]|uniref:Death domain-containing protein n=1 Tax=Exaiptasia diaphana TaxID=2652724 RepID=A0A913Y050_EXADI|nr:uncharacterized protein LOC110250379 [Exaiptasia diaphana]
MDNERKISEAITNSTSDIMDKIALKLDSASTPTCTWMEFGLELGITRDKLKEFEMYTSYNPTEALFRYVYSASGKQIKASVIIGYLEQMNRWDILTEVFQTMRLLTDIAKDAQDIFKLGSELLETISRKLNEDCPGVGGWRVLARRLIADHYIDDPDIISELEPPHQHEIHSSTKKIIEWLSANKPDVTIGELIAKCGEINRKDAVEILTRYFPRSAHAQILQNDWKNFGLPPKSTTKMIGREKDKEDLIEEIVDGKNPLIVLHAATGYGKETLAVATAYELIENHDYTCIYVDVDRIKVDNSAITVEELASKILETCGIPFPTMEDKKEVQELFKKVTRKCLLILDNFDQAFYAENKRIDSMDNRSYINNYRLPRTSSHSSSHVPVPIICSTSRPAMSRSGSSHSVMVSRAQKWSRSTSRSAISGPAMSRSGSSHSVMLSRAQKWSRSTSRSAISGPAMSRSGSSPSVMVSRAPNKRSFFALLRSVSVQNLPETSNNGSPVAVERRSLRSLKENNGIYHTSSVNALPGTDRNTNQATWPDDVFHDTDINPNQATWPDDVFSDTDRNPNQEMTRKEEFQMFIGDLLKYSSRLKILATAWESFSTSVDTKVVELPPLTKSDSEEIVLSRCGMDRSIITSDLINLVLEGCSGIPQLLRNAAMVNVRFGFEDLASSPPERQLKLLCPSYMSPKERFDHRLRVCFDRLHDISRKVLMVVSVLPGFFTLDEAATIFKDAENISSKEELQDGLTDLVNFSFLSYNQERKGYYLRPAMRSFAIYEATFLSVISTTDSDLYENELGRSYKEGISRFVHYTFHITFMEIENDFFSIRSENAVQRYREQEANLRKIANWCISNTLDKDQEMKRLRYHINNVFVDCYLVTVTLVEDHLLKTILSIFSRFYRCEDGGFINTESKKKYVERLTIAGVACISSCHCVPQPCQKRRKQAMFYFNKVLEELCSSPRTVSSLHKQLKSVSKCKIMSRGIQIEFLLKYGKCLILEERKKDGLKFIEKGIKISKKVFKKSNSNKDRVMVAVGYNDLASAYSYNNDANVTAIQIRQSKVLPVYEEHLGRHPFTASALRSLAHNFLALGSYEEALEVCQIALSHRKQLFGEHSETARSLFDMGQILRKQASNSQNPEDKHKRYEDALSCLNDALEMRQHLAPTSVETTQNHQEIAHVLNSLGRDEEARTHEEKASDCSKHIDIQSNIPICKRLDMYD